MKRKAHRETLVQSKLPFSKTQPPKPPPPYESQTLTEAVASPPAALAATLTAPLPHGVLLGGGFTGAHHHVDVLTLEDGLTFSRDKSGSELQRPEMSVISPTTLQLGRPPVEAPRQQQQQGNPLAGRRSGMLWSMHADKIIGHANAVRQIKEWGSALVKTLLVLSGHTGCGKTSLGRAALKSCKVTEVWDARAAFEQAPDAPHVSTLKWYMESPATEGAGVFIDELDTLDGADRGDIVKYLKSLEFDKLPCHVCLTVSDDDFNVLKTIQAISKSATFIKLWRPRDSADMSALAAHVMMQRSAKLDPATVQSIVSCANGDRRKLINMLELECRVASRDAGRTATGPVPAAKDKNKDGHRVATGAYDAFESPWTEAASALRGVKLHAMTDPFLTEMLLVENFARQASDIHACATVACSMSDAASTGYDAAPVSEFLILRAVAREAAGSAGGSKDGRAGQLMFPRGLSASASAIKNRARVRDIIKTLRLNVDVGDISQVMQIITSDVPTTGKKRGVLLKARGVTPADVSYVSTRFG
jgi:hypothetical protein